MDYEYTAKLEDELDDISNGKEEWVPMLEKFWKDFSAQIDEKESVSRKDVTQEQLEETCPKCGDRFYCHSGDLRNTEWKLRCPYCEREFLQEESPRIQE